MLVITGTIYFNKCDLIISVLKANKQISYIIYGGILYEYPGIQEDRTAFGWLGTSCNAGHRANQSSLPDV